MRWREQIDAVVAPSKPSGEFGDRHQLDHRDAQARELRQFRGGGGEGPDTREGADVQFVDDLSLDRDAAPAIVGPFERAGIHDLRRTVRTFWLEPGRGIWIEPLVVAQPELIAVARRRVDERAEVAVRVAQHRDRPRVQHDLDAIETRRPDAHVRAAVADVFGANRQSAANGRPLERRERRLDRGIGHGWPTQVQEWCRAQRRSEQSGEHVTRTGALRKRESQSGTSVG